MERWSDFFLGELGASAALSGLLFVSVSVNQTRILELGRMADRAIEALALLFLIMGIATFGLAPFQSPRLFGAEVLALAVTLLSVLLPVQRRYLRQLVGNYRKRSMMLVHGARLAVGLIILSAVALIGSGVAIAAAFIVPAVLVVFAVAGAGAWVLLIEINR
jgi:hypothetical protein